MTESLLHSRERGYVLLLTLLLLAMMATGLAGMARRSHHAILEANRSEQEIQREWLSRSAESVLPAAEKILTQNSKNVSRPSDNLVLIYALDNHHVSLSLSDEQAKANLNALWKRSDPAIVRATAQTLATSVGFTEELNLRPLGTFEVVAAGSRADWPVFGAYEQLFPSGAIQQEIHKASIDASVIGVITLWGDGRLRIERADPAVLHAVLFPLLSPSQIQQLSDVVRYPVSEDRKPPVGPSTTSIIYRVGLELTDRQQELLSKLVTDESKCFSVRLRFDDGRRVRSTLAVRQNDSKAESLQITRFNW